MQESLLFKKRLNLFNKKVHNSLVRIAKEKKVDKIDAFSVNLRLRCVIINLFAYAYFVSIASNIRLTMSAILFSPNVTIFAIYFFPNMPN